MWIYNALVPQSRKMLKNLDQCLSKAITYAEEKNFDAERLAVARLAPDHFSLSRHVQRACDAAKIGAARLADVSAPEHTDGEAPLGDVRQRIGEVIAFLDGIEASQLKGAAEKEIALPFLKGKVLSGEDYLNEFVLPNLYFHITCAYAILRHNGVPLDKGDFIRPLSSRDPKGV